MANTLEQSHALQLNSAFRNKVQAAIIRAALDVQNEDPNDVGGSPLPVPAGFEGDRQQVHNKRTALAHAILSGQRLEDFVRAIAADPNNAGVGASSDDDILFTVGIVFTALALDDNGTAP
ncbi:MAG: hypothetical protein ACYTG0_02880 [Planctomycetota bacterium]|jgi:hypothetical protein